MLTTIIIILLLMILQFLLLQNYINRSLNQQTEKVELLLKSASITLNKIDEVKDEIKELKK
jgi:hypothetical protein